MPNILIGDLVAPLNVDQPDTHTMRACQTIMAQVRKVKDDAPQKIFDNVELTQQRQQSIYRPNAPYALLSILPSAANELTGEGTTVWSKVPLQLALIFSAKETDTESTLQPWANWLGMRVYSYLDPFLADNLNGIDFRNEVNSKGCEIWQWDLKAKRKETLDRKVMQTEGGSQKLTGSRWRYLMEFGIRTWPCMILP